MFGTGGIAEEIGVALCFLDAQESLRE